MKATILRKCQKFSHLGLVTLALISMVSQSVLAQELVQNKPQVFYPPGNRAEDFDLRKTIPMKGQTITVDTRDEEACRSIQDALDPDQADPQIHALCERDDDRPFATAIIANEMPREEFKKTILSFGPKTNQHLLNLRNTIFLGGVGLGFYMTKSHSKVWHPTIKDIPRLYAKHVKAGPRIDKDKALTNFVFHPMAGATFFSIARHSGFSFLESMGFSAFVSTFMWEYGFEAPFQVPSLNDLFVTPILGSLLGELFYQIHESIEKNDGRVLGSPALGTIIQVITNPGHYFSEALNEVLGRNTFKDASMDISVRNPTPIFAQSENYGPRPQKVKAFMVNFRFKF